MTHPFAPSPECPQYRYLPQREPLANGDYSVTTLYMVVCDEGWRTTIVCSGMYDWAAAWLVETIQGRPYGRGGPGH